MTREELLQRLKEAADHGPEEGHRMADRALLEYINDPEVTAAYDDFGKWYA